MLPNKAGGAREAEHKKLISESSLDQNFITFTSQGAGLSSEPTAVVNFNSHTMDSRPMTAAPANIISGTYINSNIIVH